jgi:hypothetical protein
MVRRVAIELGVILFITVIEMIQHNGYADGSDGSADLLNALYDAPVSVTTTEFGDITPVSDSARPVDIVQCATVKLAHRTWGAQDDDKALAIVRDGDADDLDGTPVIKSSGQLVVLRPNHH